MNPMSTGVFGPKPNIKRELAEKAQVEIGAVGSNLD